MSLLIRENENVINYSYSIDFIKKINNKSKINEDKYYKIIISKIIIELIKNYKGLYEYEYNKEEIERIENENKKIINDNIHIFNELGIDWKFEDMELIKVDEIYANIIIALIIKSKFEEYQNIYSIIKQLNLESIDITNIIYDKINNILESNEIIKNKYLISKTEDLNDEKKINFYFILFKYILKNSYLIDKIKIILESKKNIINSNIFYSLKINDLNENIKDKLIYLKEIIIDSQNYLKNKNTYNIKIDKNNEEKDIERKDKKINDNNEKKNINNINQNSNSNNLETKYNPTNEQSSTNSSNIKINNIDLPNSKFTNNNSKISENNSKNWKKLYDDPNPQEKSSSDNKNEKKKEEDRVDIKKNEKRVYIRTIGAHEEIGKLNDNKEIQIPKTAEFITEMITEKNQFYISAGTNNELIIYDREFKIKRYFKNIKNYQDWTYNLLEFKKEKDKLLIMASSKTSIYLFSIDSNFQISIIQEGFLFENYSSNYLIEIPVSNNKDSNTYFSCCEDKVILLNNIFSKIVQIREDLIFDKIVMKCGIKINDKIIVFKSNRVISKGDDKLIFFNYLSKKKICNNTIKGNFSFVYSTNGLVLMPLNNSTEKNINYKVLLCACKKYIKNQKNGILQINILPKEDKQPDITNIFYDTKNFEVYCICPILKYKVININKKQYQTIDTNFFLVGGFEIDRKKGMIKLYKINYGIKYDKQTSIQYIKDIDAYKINNEDIDHNENINIYQIKKPISCIIQTNIDESILVSSWDGNVYQLNNINLIIQDYLDNEVQFEKKVSFNEFFK